MHISIDSRARYQVGPELFTQHSGVVFPETRAARELAHRINEVRNARRFPESAVRGGDLYAAALLDEIMRLALEVYREATDPTAFADADVHLQDALGERLDEVLLAFATHFPALPVYRDGQAPAEYLAGRSGGRPHREIVIEELLLLRIGNLNPGRVRFRELFTDLPLEERTRYRELIAALDDFLERRPGPGVGGGSIVSLLRAPARNSPTSLEGQLAYVRDHWAALLGDRFAALLQRVLGALDVLAEERKLGGFGGPSGPPPVLDAEALRGAAEYERFSADSSWMPSLVMIAKSTFVWLDQLARAYRRRVERLDEIPDEELDRLAGAGFTGLWLIGIWERSEASRRIKQMRGDHEAVASAYSLYDYAVAGDLGGEAAYHDLRERAWRRGIRLASDMVPNHVGIDGRWVIEHPDWFLSLDRSPYPGYTFTGADLCSHPDISVQIEDHYWDGTDAAVVFKRYDHRTGDSRFLYHGNDGTSMPWNDTAQLDYLNPDTREAVIQTILHVARQFPIIRFDAAMTLAKRHVQRLWYPPPGQGGAIPSRAEHGMSAAEFDRRLPHEFWREVVDRVAAEVPDTLLLAEAFWMLEGYFVRTLGMHRVYNSAFMHMTSREDNGDYRRLMKNVLEFDPEVLKRFVNFMNNPDEETAIAQFGKDDKYFGVATLMATMPGLPMFGHGQVEGFTEKYGMEFRRAKQEEWPDEWLVDRHRREIFPLLHRRRQFAEVGGFLLFDCVTGSGDVNEDVFAYSNLVDGQASLVLYNNRFSDARGWINTSVPYSVPTGEGRSLTSRTLAAGLGLRAGPDDFTVLPDHVSGLQYLRRSTALRDDGLEVNLGAYERRVFVDIHEVTDGAGDYAELADELGGRGVPDVGEALDLRRLRPLHRVLADVLAAADVVETDDGDEDVDEDELRAAYRAFVAIARPQGSEHGREVRTDAFVARLDAVGRLPRPHLLLAAQRRRLGDRLVPDRRQRAVLTALAAVRYVDGLGRFGDWHLRTGLASAFAELGFDDEEPRQMAALTEVLARHPDWPAAATERHVLRDLLADDVVREFLKVNTFEGVEWFDGPAFRALGDGLVLAALVRVRGKASKVEYRHIAELALGLAEAGEQAEHRVDRLLGAGAR